MLCLGLKCRYKAAQEQNNPFIGCTEGETEDAPSGGKNQQSKLKKKNLNLHREAPVWGVQKPELRLFQGTWRPRNQGRNSHQ